MVACLTPQGLERTKGPLRSERSDCVRDLGNTNRPNCQNSELVKRACYIFDCSQQERTNRSYAIRRCIVWVVNFDLNTLNVTYLLTIREKKQLNYPPQLLHDQALGIWLLAFLEWAECPHHSGGPY